MIVFDCKHNVNQSSQKRLRKSVEEQMERDGMIGRSSSGLSAIIAVEWCEKNGYMWELSGNSKIGYSIRKLEKIE